MTTFRFFAVVGWLAVIVLLRSGARTVGSVGIVFLVIRAGFSVFVMVIIMTTTEPFLVVKLLFGKIFATLGSVFIAL